MILVCGGLLVALIVAGGLWAIMRDSRQDLTLSEIARTASENDGYADAALTGLEENTAALCDDVDGCIEGFSSTTVDLYRFSSKEQATEFATAEENSYQSDWIVIVYRDTSLSNAERSELATLIDTLWNSG